MRRLRYWLRYWLSMYRHIRASHTVIMLSVESKLEDLTWHPIDGFTNGTLTHAYICGAFKVPGFRYIELP